MKILFTGGGSGGHVLPIVALSREIRKIYPPSPAKRDKGLEFLYMGPKDDFGAILLSQEGIKIKTILAGKIRRYFNFRSFMENLLDLFLKIPAGIFMAFFKVLFSGPDLIFSKGGYGSLPVVIAGWLLWIPVFLHESDVKPGLANKFLSFFAKKIFVSFPGTHFFPPRKMILTGNPVRIELLEGTKEEARRLFEIKSQKPVILILGGSQGAQRMNDKILETLNELLKNFEVIHQAGENNFRQVKAEVKVIENKDLKDSYHLIPFLKEETLKQAYAICDLIVSRAGSGSIFEIAALGKPSILVPLPEAAQNHQVENAYSYSQNGSTVVLEEPNFTHNFFLEKLKFIFSHPEELEKMAKAAKEFAKPEAAKSIAEYIIGR
jgi:UDP-N-acetylglucosamine--N-acetylmuramyl-(pentapeptide) pyrophosphoryl-undecaprenol N-acetylglucosamine transferase